MFKKFLLLLKKEKLIMILNFCKDFYIFDLYSRCLSFIYMYVFNCHQICVQCMFRINNVQDRSFQQALFKNLKLLCCK